MKLFNVNKWFDEQLLSLSDENFEIFIKYLKERRYLLKKEARNL